MRKNLTAVVVLFLAMLLVESSPVEAVQIQGEMPDGKTMMMGNILFDEASASGGELDFDVIYDTGHPVWIAVDITSADSNFLPQIAFSGNFINNFSAPLGSLLISLESEEDLPDPTFSAINEDKVDISGVDDDEHFFSIVGNEGESEVLLTFNPPLTADTAASGFALGVPATHDPINPGLDWFIDTQPLQPGQTFHIHLEPNPIPEPLSATLGLVSLSVVGFTVFARRRVVGFSPSPRLPCVSTPTGN